MKSTKALLLIGLACALSSTVSAAVARTADHDVVIATSNEFPTMDAYVISAPAEMLTIEIYNGDLTLSNQVGYGVNSFDLVLPKPELGTEPVKRSYRYVFIRRFDWRCQKK